MINLLLYCFLLLHANGKRTAVKIGALFPFYMGPSQPSYSGMRHLEAFRLAVAAVNKNKNILPTTEMKYSIRESQGKPGVAAVATQSLIVESKVDVVLVGGEDVFAAYAAAAAEEMAFIGHTATAPSLSDKSVYPNFVRTSISASLVARNIAAFVRSSVLGASHVKVISGSDEYSSDLTHSFLQHAASRSIGVIDTVQFTAGSKNLMASVALLFQDLEVQRASSEIGTQHLVLVFAGASDTINVMKAAHSMGVSGSRVTWILSESVLEENDAFRVSMGDDLDVIMAGSFVVHASNGRDSAAYVSLWDNWKTQQATSGTLVESGIEKEHTADAAKTTYGVHGMGPKCKSGVDSDGNNLYMFDDDDNESTPKSCGGVNFVVDADATKTLTFYIPFVFDAVFLVAHALHELIEVNNADTFTATELVHAMKQISFQGASGAVMLNVDGDRRVDEPFSCVVSNFDTSTHGMEPVGWMKSGKNNSEVVAFILNNGASLAYSSANGKRPTFFPSMFGSSDTMNPILIMITIAIPFISILIASIAIRRQRHSMLGTKLTGRQQRINRLSRVLLQNESFHIVAKDVSSGSTFNCHRSTWVTETHLVDVALLVLSDHRNIEKTAVNVRDSLADEVYFMKKLQQHPNILHCYGLLLMGSPKDSKISAEDLHPKKVDKSNVSEVTLETLDGAKPISASSTHFSLSQSSVTSTLPAVVPLDMSPFPNFVEMIKGTLSSVALVLEWCEHGSLTRVLREKRGKLTLAQRLQMSSELSHAVWCLHSQEIPLAHPNLTSANVYITIDFHVKLGGCFSRQSQTNQRSKHRNEVPDLQANIVSLAQIMRELLSVSGDVEEGVSLVVPSCLNTLVLAMESEDPTIQPSINVVAFQVDAALADLQTQTFEAAAGMSSSLFDTVWSKDVNMNDPQRSQVKAQSSLFVESSIVKKLVAPEDLHVLLVDDDDFALASMQHALEMCHYSVTGCNSGKKAMDFLQDKPNKYDVVLSDAFMPAMNGLSLLGAVKSDRALRHIPVVLVSSSTAQIMQALKLGARDYLVKPLRVFEAMTLFPKVKMWRIRMERKNPLSSAQLENEMPLEYSPEHTGRSRSQLPLIGDNIHDGSSDSSFGTKTSTSQQHVVSQMTEKLLSTTSTGVPNLDLIKLLVAGYTKDINPHDIGVPLITWQNIQLTRIAGAGSGGCVLEGTMKDNTLDAGLERSVACKRFDRGVLQTNGDAVKGYLKEVELLSTLHHPNIMQLIGIAEHEEFVWHICEFAEFGSLSEMLSEPNVATFLTISKRIDILVGVADALNYMHSLTPTIIHRDLKPSNILLFHDLTAKLSDFAYSRSIDGPRKMTRCGTPAYVAPEVMLGHPYDESIDTYAFGVVLWQIITRAKPFSEENDPVAILKKTSSGERCEFPSFEVCRAVSGNDDLKTSNYKSHVELAQVCWHQDPSRRPQMFEVIDALQGTEEGTFLSR